MRMSKRKPTMPEKKEVIKFDLQMKNEALISNSSSTTTTTEKTFIRYSIPMTIQYNVLHHKRNEVTKSKSDPMIELKQVHFGTWKESVGKESNEKSHDVNATKASDHIISSENTNFNFGLDKNIPPDSYKNNNATEQSIKKKRLNAKSNQDKIFVNTVQINNKTASEITENTKLNVQAKVQSIPMRENIAKNIPKVNDDKKITSLTNDTIVPKKKEQPDIQTNDTEMNVDISEDHEDDMKMQEQEEKTASENNNTSKVLNTEMTSESMPNSSESKAMRPIIVDSKPVAKKNESLAEIFKKNGITKNLELLTYLETLKGKDKVQPMGWTIPKDPKAAPVKNNMCDLMTNACGNTENNNGNDAIKSPSGLIGKSKSHQRLIL